MRVFHRTWKKTLLMNMYTKILLRKKTTRLHTVYHGQYRNINYCIKISVDIDSVELLC